MQHFLSPGGDLGLVGHSLLGRDNLVSRVRWHPDESSEPLRRGKRNPYDATALAP